MVVGKLRWDLDEPYIMEVQLIDVDDTPDTGETVSYNIREADTNTSIDSGTLTEVGTTGVYKKPFTFTVEKQYRITYSVTGYPDVVESISIEDVTATIVDIETDLDLIKDQTAPGGKWL